MKRSFLEEFGIEKSIIDKIMEANRNDINNAKTDVDDLKKQISDLKTELDNKEASHKAEIEAVMIDNAVRNELIRFNAKTEKAVRALIDMDSVKIDEKGDVSGIREQLENLKNSEETGYLFNNVEFTGTNIGESPLEPEMNFDDMNYTQMCAYLENR